MTVQLDDIQQLMQENNDHTLSLYLRIDPALRENQADKPAWRIFLKNAVQDFDFNEYGDTYNSWSRIRDRAMAFLDDYEPGGKGLVLFFSDTADRVYELPAAPASNEAHFGAPRLAPMLALVNDFKRYVIALIDSENARFLTSYLGDIGQEDAMLSEYVADEAGQKTLTSRSPGADSGGSFIAGSNRDRYDDRVDDAVDRFHRDVAERIGDVIRDTGAERLILGGVERAAHAVKDKLSPENLQALVDVIAAPLNENNKDLLSRVLPIAQAHEQQVEQDLIAEIIDGARANGRGALGEDAVEHALDMRQVETLVATYPPDDANLLQTLIEKAAQSGSHIILLRDAEGALADHDGVAARLYYAIGSAANGR